MSFGLFTAVAVVPGLIAAGVVSTYYTQNPISKRFSFHPFDSLLERQITRKVLKTWGSKLILRHTQTSHPQVETIWASLTSSLNLPLPGQLIILNTSEHIFYLFPTGDMFISTGFISNHSINTMKNLLAHELAHVLLKHPQENIPYSKISCIFTAWMCRNNHHFTQELKNYLIMAKYSKLQEDEANAWVRKYFPDISQEIVCPKAMSLN